MGGSDRPGPRYPSLPPLVNNSGAIAFFSFPPTSVCGSLGGGGGLDLGWAVWTVEVSSPSSFLSSSYPLPLARVRRPFCQWVPRGEGTERGPIEPSGRNFFPRFIRKIVFSLRYILPVTSLSSFCLRNQIPFSMLANL